MKISDIDAYTVFDSRGFPTIECRVILENGKSGSAIVPSGASTGKFESWELRDGNPAVFGGKSVFKAIEHIKELIRPLLIGELVDNQRKLDELMIELDGTPNKSNLGANAILAVSMASARAAANAKNLPLYAYLGGPGEKILPLPEIQIIGGGAHSAGRIDVQDFMIICTGASTLMEVYQMTFDIYRAAGEIMESEGKLAGVADEGGYWPVFDSNEAVFDVLVKAINDAGYQPGVDVFLSLDIAAAELYEKGRYKLSLEDRQLSSPEFYELIDHWLATYPICSIEDPFAEEDVENWQELTHQWGDKVQIIGDDLLVTNSSRLEWGIRQKLANSVLIKLNQVGTVTETLDCIAKAKAAGWRPVVSARSGETEDAFIAHLSVGTNAGQLKVGSFTRSERMVKWNELLRIERDLGDRGNFANNILRFPWA